MGDNNGGEPQMEVNIQDVILERKAERKLKAEQKRQADLQRIRGMRSTTGIEPLEQFPKEIWEKIFDLLEPKDRGNIWQVHPLFRDMMESIQVRDILLPQILKIEEFINYLERSSRNPYNEELRLISKSCRNSFDRDMEEYLIKCIGETKPNSSTDLVGIETIYFNQGDSDELEVRLLASFLGSKNPGKRFFPRGLSICISEFHLDLFDQFKSDITILLGKIGDQIWHFRFLVKDLETVHVSFSDVYILLHGWISLMPNLKWLEVSIQPSTQMLETERMWDACSTLQNHQFPNLTHLQRLSLHSDYRPPKIGAFGIIYEAVLRANPHVKMLDLANGNGNLSDLQVLPDSLTHFAIWDEGAGSLTEHNANATTLEKIFPIVRYNWPLRKIILNLKLGSSQEGNSIISVFKFLEHFPTLEQVHLRLGKGFSIGDTEKLGYLKLYNLANLSLEIIQPAIDYESNTNFFFSLQFLVQCKKLKWIYWELNGFDEKKLRSNLKSYGSKDMVGFKAGLRYLYDSNIWDVFPYLESVHVENYTVLEIECCLHTYYRMEAKTMTIRKFLNQHHCSRINDLTSCVMLVK